MLDRKYGGYVWTTHALERLQLRNLTQAEVYLAIRHPTTSSSRLFSSAIKYRLVTDTKLIEVIVKDDRGQRIVVTCWSSNKSKFKPQIPLWEKIIRKLFHLPSV